MRSSRISLRSRLAPCCLKSSGRTVPRSFGGLAKLPLGHPPVILKLRGGGGGGGDEGGAASSSSSASSIDEDASHLDSFFLPERASGIDEDTEDSEEDGDGQIGPVRREEKDSSSQEQSRGQASSGDEDMESGDLQLGVGPRPREDALQRLVPGGARQSSASSDMITSQQGQGHRRMMVKPDFRSAAPNPLIQVCKEFLPVMEAANADLERAMQEEPWVRKKLSMEVDENAPHEEGQIQLSLFNVHEGDPALRQVRQSPSPRLPRPPARAPSSAWHQLHP